MMRVILLLTLLITNYSWGLDDIAIIDNESSSVNIGLNGLFFKDPSGQLTLNDLLAPEYANRFIPIQQSFIQLGLVKGNIWIKTQISNQRNDGEALFLSIQAPRLQNLEIYAPEINHTQPLITFGNSLPFSNRTINHPDYIYFFPNNARNTTTIYIKMASHLPINASISISTPSTFSVSNQSKFMFSGIIIGIIFILFISNMFFFTKTKQLMYATYAALLIGVALLHMSLHGYLFQLLPEWIGFQERIYNFASLFCTAAITLFSRYYLNTQRYFSRVDQMLKILSIANLSLAVLFATIPEQLNILYLSLMAVFTLLALTALAIYAFFLHIPYSNYYLLARSILFVGHSVWILTVYGVISNNFLYQWGLTFFILLEALIHFTGMMAQLIPFDKSSNKANNFTNESLFPLLGDISGRMQRQNNIIDGYLSGVRSHTSNQKDQEMNQLASLALSNLKHLSNKLNSLNRLPNTSGNDYQNAILLDQLIHQVKEEFAHIDQDNVEIDFVCQNTHNIELLRDIDIISQLLLNLALECKLLNTSKLSIFINKVDHNRFGIKTLDIQCHSLPSRSLNELENFNLGLGYIKELVIRLSGTIAIQGQKDNTHLEISFPIHTHTQNKNQSLKYQDVASKPCQILVLGKDSPLFHRVMPAIETWVHDVIHVTSISELIAHLSIDKQRTSITILMMFENDGYIPHLSLKQIREYLLMGDQCLFVTENAKMPRNYALTLGFDDLFSDTDIENNLKPHLEKLAAKGFRLREASLSQVKESSNTR